MIPGIWQVWRGRRSITNYELRIENYDMKGFFEKIWRLLKEKYAGWRAEIEMKMAIRAVNSLYKKSRYESRFHTKGSERETRLYLVLITIPVTKRLNYAERQKIDKNSTKKGRFVRIALKEKLYWVNRGNFRAVKRKRWLPITMKLDELREKAFYYTDSSRSYGQEQNARKAAIDKYKLYKSVTAP